MLADVAEADSSLRAGSISVIIQLAAVLVVDDTVVGIMRLAGVVRKERARLELAVATNLRDVGIVRV